MKFEIPSREGKRRIVTRDAYEVTARSSRKCTAGYVGFMLDKAVHVSICENVPILFKCRTGCENVYLIVQMLWIAVQTSIT